MSENSKIVTFNYDDMAFWGDYDVIRQIKLKRQLIKKGSLKEKKIKTAVIFCGGGHKGVFLSGFALGMQHLSLSSAVDACIGISTGALGGYYFVGRKPQLGSTLIDISLEEKLIYPKRFIIMNRKRIEEWLRNKHVDLYVFKKSRTKLLVALTDHNGNGYFVDVSKVKDPIPYIMASMNHPLVTGGSAAWVDGKKIVDGCIGNPLPITYAINSGYTDILVVMTEPIDVVGNFYFGSTFFEKVCKKIFFTSLNKNLQNKLHTYSLRYELERKYFTGEVQPPTGVRLAAIYPKNLQVGTFCYNKELLYKARDASKEFVIELFKNA